jgi:hypothetical protein
MNACDQLKTGWPPGMLQDDSPELSRWLASKPDALVHVRAAAGFVHTRSRVSDCDTSKTAAKAATTRKADSERIAIAAAVKAAPGGLTAREVATQLGSSMVEISRRISECGLTKTAEIRDGCRVWTGNSA